MTTTATEDQTARILATYGSPRQRYEYAAMEAARIHREARDTAYARYEADGDTEAYRHAVLTAWDASQTAIADAWATYATEELAAREPARV